MGDRPLKVAVLGTRGLPARYGGRETAIDEIGRRLVTRGHDLVVYSRVYGGSSQRLAEYEGVRLVHLPSLRSKNLDTALHVFLSLVHLTLRENVRVVLLSGSGTAFAIAWLHLLRRKTVLWVDGKAWTRHKWGRIARLFLEQSARFGVRHSDAMVTDTPLAHRFYLEEMGRDTACIPYGANIETVAGTEELQRHRLESGDYVLFVGRLTPEKGVQYLIEAFEGIDTSRKLVIVGDNPYDRRFVEQLRSTRDPRIVFTGYVFDLGFRQLMQHCRLYVQPSDVEGTSPVLLTAMALGRPVVVNGIPENLATIAEAGLSFPPGDVQALRHLLVELLEDTPRLEELGGAARERVRAHFNWDRIADQFEEVLRGLA